VRGFIPIFKRELFSLFVTPLAWILIAVFVVVQGIHFIAIITQYAGSSEASIAGGPAEAFLGGTIFLYLPLLLICPLLTMRLFSEERKSGTIEALLTAPVSTTGVVLGKYAAAVVIYASLWAPTGLYMLILAHYGSVDVRAISVAYLGILLIGAGYLAFGIMTSALSSNQLVAAFLSGLLIVALFIAGAGVYFFEPTGSMHAVSEYVSVFSMMGEFSRGLVDSRRLLYSAIIIVVPLFFTVRLVEAWRWG
jgi:ABC-2 type transport system permease protein